MIELKLIDKRGIDLTIPFDIRKKRERIEKRKKKEDDIVTMISNGSTNKEIAKNLKLSERTIEIHVRNLCKKYDSVSRSHLVGTFFRLDRIK